MPGGEWVGPFPCAESWGFCGWGFSELDGEGGDGGGSGDGKLQVVTKE